MKGRWLKLTAVVLVLFVFAPVATLANFLELPAAFLRLLAVFAVFADGFLQILFGLVDVTVALVVASARAGVANPASNDAPNSALNIVFPNKFFSDIVTP